jgi:RNA polymerase sigma-70 factor, ECF subfamily
VATPNADRVKWLEELVREHQARLRAFVCLRTGDPDLADDIVQDVFVIAYRKFETLDLSAPMFPWLLTVARTELRQQWRNKERSNEPDRVAALMATQLERTEQQEPATGFEERFEQLKKCVARLPDKLRSLVDLVYGENKGCEEASGALGMTCIAARVALHRARKTLRECIERSSQEKSA